MLLYLDLRLFSFVAAQKNDEKQVFKVCGSGTLFWVGQI